MKKQYTKKQITEAIAYWKGQLNEQSSNDVSIVDIQSKLYQTLNKIDDHIEDLEGSVEVLNDIAKKLDSDELRDAVEELQYDVDKIKFDILSQHGSI